MLIFIKGSMAKVPRAERERDKKVLCDNTKNICIRNFI